jgi:hypothetical protein
MTTKVKTASSTTSEKDTVIRFAISEEEKTLFQRSCKSRGVNMSQRMRQMVLGDLSEPLSTIASDSRHARDFQKQDLTSQAATLQDILSSAKIKNEASNLPSPSIEQIDAYIDKIREDRIKAAVVV